MAGDPEYDNRLTGVLITAFQGWDADVRNMMMLMRSTPADHESPERLECDELLEITEADASVDATSRPIVVILDDVLNSGKYFKVGQQRIRERHPSVDIRGLVLARCIRD